VVLGGWCLYSFVAGCRVLEQVPSRFPTRRELIPYCGRRRASPDRFGIPKQSAFGAEGVGRWSVADGKSVEDSLKCGGGADDVGGNVL